MSELQLCEWHVDSNFIWLKGRMVFGQLFRLHCKKYPHQQVV